jgi:hypothetical protein
VLGWELVRVNRLGAKVTLALLCVVACSPFAISPAYGAWSAPKQIVSSRVWEYSRPLVATDRAGGGMLVWYREEELNETLGGIEASTRATGRWSASVVLASGQPGAVFDPQLAMSAGGQATAVWQNVTKIQVATSHLPRGFGRARTLSRPVQGASKPTVALDARGDTTVVYPRSATGLWVLTRRAGRRWRALPPLEGTSRSNISEPQVAMDERGEAIIAWVRGNGGSGSQVQVVVLGANDKPRHPPQTLSSAKRQEIDELRLAVNSSGGAVLVWQQKEKGGPTGIEAATRRAGARFTHPEALSRQRGTDELSTAIDARGLAAILFSRTISTQPGVPEVSSNSYPAYTQTAAVEVSTHAVGHRWSEPGKLAPNAKGSTSEPQVACNPSGGTLVAIWTSARFRSSEVAAYTGNIETSIASSSGSWQAPAVISPPNSFAPALAVSANEKATAAWVGAPESSKTESIETTDYEPG